MKKVLVIAYYFPPMGLSGVQRTAKFVKYLPTFQWSPTVLTVVPRYIAEDKSLLHEVEREGVQIVRTDTLDPTRIFRTGEVVKLPPEWLRRILHGISQTIFIPDNKVGWKGKATKAAEALLARERFDLIFATAPPYTDFLVGVDLKKKFGIPLVIDYRDPWVDNPWNFYATPIHKALHAHLEKKVLHATDKVITINRRIKEKILKRYSFLRYDDVAILPQGFDPEDFQLDGTEGLPRTHKMRITYSGTFIADRKPKVFLEGLRRAFRVEPGMRGRIEACFVGMFREENLKLVRKLGLDNDVNVVGYVDHAECVKYLLASDVLWLTFGDQKGMDVVSTGKLHEYLGARKFILGCVPDGAAKSTILDSEGGMVVEPNDPDGIARAIVELYRRYKNNGLQPPGKDFVDRFDRRTITADLAKLFELVTE